MTLFSGGLDFNVSCKKRKKTAFDVLFYLLVYKKDAWEN